MWITIGCLIFVWTIYKMIDWRIEDHERRCHRKDTD